MAQTNKNIITAVRQLGNRMKLFKRFRKDYIYRYIGPSLKGFNRAMGHDEKYNQEFRIF